MTNTFEGKPDARQSADVNHRVSRFRPTYRALTDDEKKLHDEIKAIAEKLEDVLGDVLIGCKKPEGARYHALAITDLEKSVMWAVKALTA